MDAQVESDCSHAEDEQEVDEEEIDDLDPLSSSEEEDPDSGVDAPRPIDDVCATFDICLSSPTNKLQSDMPKCSKFVFDASNRAFHKYINMTDFDSMTDAKSIQHVVQWQQEKHAFKRVLQKMAAARGFFPFDESASYLEASLQKTLSSIAREHKNVIVNVNPRGQVMLSIYVKCGKLSIQTARVVEKILGRVYPTHLLIVTPTGVTPVAKKLLVTLHNNTQFFLTTELQKNYADHHSVPTQAPLADAERDALLKKYGITKDQLPIMLRTDSISKYYGWAPGTVVKSTRILGGALEPYVYYRVVK